MNQTDSTFLRTLAQNDYMIDTQMLPDGHRLNEVAGEIERLNREVQMWKDEAADVGVS